MVKKPKDLIIEVTSSGVCGSDLHLIAVITPFMTVGDVMGDEPVGIVREVGSQVTAVEPDNHVVVPYNISCGTCWMCSQGQQSQCETTGNRERGFGASLFGYTNLYGHVPGGQAEYLRVPFGDTLPIKVPEGPSDDLFVYLSDVLPTAWQAVQYAGIPKDGSVLVLGLGPLGDVAEGSALHLAAKQVFSAEVVPERLARAGARSDSHRLDAAGGRGPGGRRRHRRPRPVVIRRRRHGGHGSPSRAAQKASVVLPTQSWRRPMHVAGIDRLAALTTVIEAVRRGGTISLSGLYGGATDPLPLMRIFDKQIQLRRGQANAWGWVPTSCRCSPTRTRSRRRIATYHAALEEEPQAYMNSRERKEGAVKALLRP